MTHQSNFDVIIIGSGLGGLLCGNLLAKKGYRVQILEKQYQIGGSLQTFRRDGCTFDTGVHYVGCLDKGEILHQIYKYLGILDAMGVERLDTTGFDIICIGDKEYKLQNGYDNFAASLKAYFPDEAQAIDTFVDKLKEVWNSTKLLNFDGNLTDETPGIWKYGQNAYDYLCELTQNETLRAILAGNNGLYAGKSDKTPLYLLANINSFFIKSAWRLAHGGAGMAKAMADNIIQLGGEVLTKKDVVALKGDSTAINEVVCSDGTTYSAKWVISNIHPAVLMDMVEPGTFRSVYSNRVKTLENTCSAFTIYLKLKKGTAPHLNANIYYSKDLNVWNQAETPADQWPRGYMLYTTQDGNTGFAESMTIITMMQFDEVKLWSQSSVEQRGDDYKAFKKAKEAALLELVAEKYPNLRENIETIGSATPLTYRDYTGTVNGSIYGIEKDCNDPVRTSVFPNTKVKNLLMTGQNINIHGTLGVTMGALLTCANIIDLEELMKEIKDC